MKEKELYDLDEFLEWMGERKTFVFNCKCGAKTKYPVVSPFPENKNEPMCTDCFNSYTKKRNADVTARTQDKEKPNDL